MNRPTKTEELIEEIEEFDKWLSPTLKKYLEEVEEYLDYLDEAKEERIKIFKELQEIGFRHMRLDEEFKKHKP